MADRLLADSTQPSSLTTFFPGSIPTGLAPATPLTNNNSPSGDSEITAPVPVELASELTRQAIQNQLPEGLILDQQRSIPDCPDLVFDAFDKRLGIAAGIRRTVCVLHAVGTDEWLGERLTTIAKFTELHLRGICQPVEAGSLDDRTVYLVYPWFPAVLADHIPATGLADRTVAWALLTQLMEELADLHSHGLTHGTLRAESIFLDTPTLSGQSHVWMGNAGLHQLRCYGTSAKVVLPSSAACLPIGDGNSIESRPEDDTLALGLLAVELFAGASARRKVESAPPGIASRSNGLQQQIWWWRRHFLIEPLFVSERHRLRDGVAVLKRWHRIQRGERVAKNVALLLPLVALLVMGLWITSRPDQSKNISGNTIAADSQHLTDLENSLNATRSQLAEANTELEMLRRRSTIKTTSPSIEADARQLWQEKFASRQTSDYIRIQESLVPKPATGVQDKVDQWKSLTLQVSSDLQGLSAADPGQKNSRNALGEKAYRAFQQIPWDETQKSALIQTVWRELLASQPPADESIKSVTAALSKIPTGHWLRTELQTYVRLLQQRHAAWVRWESQPPKLIEPWNRLVETPWDRELQTAERERLQALENAENAWRKVDERSDLTWNEFKSQLKEAAGDHPRTAEVVSVWIDQFNQFDASSKATVVLLAGHSPAGYGRYRTIDMHIDGSYRPLDDEVSGDYWDAEIDHVYPAGRTISFPWRPGQSIQLYVYGSRALYRVGSRPPLLQAKQSGPVALWRMAQQQQIESGTGEDQHRLWFRVQNCPGPPPRPTEVDQVQKLIQQ